MNETELKKEILKSGIPKLHYEEYPAFCQLIFERGIEIGKNKQINYKVDCPPFKDYPKTETRQTKNLDDCTHVAPEGQFKAMDNMTRTEELKKEIEKELTCPYCKKELKEKDNYVCKHKNNNDLIPKEYIYCSNKIQLLHAELKVITETNAKWKEAVQKLKEEYDKHGTIYPYFERIFGGLI